ncbi:MAG: thiolase family protein [Actinomycetota bacterium]
MGKAVIAGVAETRFARHSDLSDLEIMADAIRLALEDAGIGKPDVDGLAICANVLPDDSSYLATHLGFESRWVMKADFGGASSLISMIRARAAIEAGLADVVVTVGGGNRADFPELHHDALSPQLDYANRSWVLPYGYGGPNSSFGLVQRRHMYEYGTTLEQLGIIATTFRQNAALNDNALLRDPMTIDDYVSSPLISDPIRKLDCVMRCAGGVAVVLCSEEFAARLGHRVVHMGASAENHAHQVLRGTPDRLETGFVAIRDALFADVSRDSLDFLQLYDDYPIAVLKQLEDLGFCESGDGGPFLERTDISLHGDLPINTGGGLLSGGQPRLGGGFIPVVEAVRQLRGEAGERQIPGAAVGLVSGIGLIDYVGNLVVTAGMILSREPS